MEDQFFHLGQACRELSTGSEKNWIEVSAASDAGHGSEVSDPQRRGACQKGSEEAPPHPTPTLFPGPPHVGPPFPRLGAPENWVGQGKPSLKTTSLGGVGALFRLA